MRLHEDSFTYTKHRNMILDNYKTSTQRMHHKKIERNIVCTAIVSTADLEHEFQPSQLAVDRAVFGS